MTIRLIVFSLVAALAYTFAYYFDWALFVYDLTAARLLFFAPPPAGPSILWYGWVGTAVVAGAVAATAVRPAAIARFLPDLLWVLPTVLIAAAFIYEKRWFI